MHVNRLHIAGMFGIQIHLGKRFDSPFIILQKENPCSTVAIWLYFIIYNFEIFFKQNFE